VKIGQKVLGEGNPVFITAELSKNHLCNLTLAKFLIDKTKEAGVDAVKFQTHIVSDELLKDDAPAPHFGQSRYEWIKQNTLPKEWFEEVFNYAKKAGIICYSTPMSRAAAELLHDIGVPVFKIASPDVSDYHMLEYVAQAGKPIIVSTGMNSMEAIRKCLDFVSRYNDQVVLLHAVSVYPCPPELMNLQAIRFLRDRFGRPVGFSDHSLGIHLSLAAVALGAVCVERHFTIDRGMPGPDHRISLIPQEMTTLVRNIRDVEAAIGDGTKKLLPEEEQYAKVFWKCVVASKAIKQGQIITRDMVKAKRPFKGIPASEILDIVGRKALVNIEEDTPVTHHMIE
jgi:N,N'-diacetyllegionaminate synthase